MTAERDCTPEELLEDICYYFASTAESFYPIDETVDGCIEALEEGLDGELPEYNKGVEYGQHSRAVIEAVDLFDRLDTYGYDPVEMAAREERRFLEKVDEEKWDDLQLDWTWYNDMVEG